MPRARVVGDRACESEVADQRAPVDADQDVVGLDVAVDQANRVCGAQSATGVETGSEYPPTIAAAPPRRG